MTTEELLDYFGTNKAAIGRILHVSRNCISYWVRTGKIPFPSQCKIELLTKGKLKADKNAYR